LHPIPEAALAQFSSELVFSPPEANQLYRKPIDALNDYFDKLDEYGVPTSRRVLAAVGPQVLKLSARRSAGAHPYLTTPEHTAQARESIGPDAFLAPEHKVVLSTDPDEARAVGRKTLELYLNLTNALTTSSGWGSLMKTSPSRAATASWTLSSPTARWTPSRQG
jgi:probable F420-dependent oxidoreductase